MSAVILAFPRGDVRPEGDSLSARAAPQTVEMTTERRDFLVGGQHLPPFSPGWCGQHLPLIEAGVELLATDDAEFGRRCALMRDADGRAMLDELAGQLERLGTCITAVGDALGLTAARIRSEKTAGA